MDTFLLSLKSLPNFEQSLYFGPCTSLQAILHIVSTCLKTVFPSGQRIDLFANQSNKNNVSLGGKGWTCVSEILK